jgi:catechol 2,3-dioxygenase-like lactoylglutathione lyase family enzyme
VLGLSVADGVALNGPGHESLWGLEGAKRREQLYWASDVLVELVEYLDPIGRPLPEGYQISDQGLLNVAFKFDSRQELRTALDRCQESGIRANSPLVTLPVLGAVVYVNDPDGFSIELMTVKPRASAHFGFEPGDTPRFAPFLGRRAMPTKNTAGIGGRGQADDRDMKQLVSLDRQFLALENGRTHGHVRCSASTNRRGPPVDR